VRTLTIALITGTLAAATMVMAKDLPPFLAGLAGNSAADLSQSLADRVAATHAKGSPESALTEDLRRQGFSLRANLFRGSQSEKSVVPSGWAEPESRMAYYAERYWETELRSETKTENCRLAARVFWNASHGMIDSLAAQVAAQQCVRTRGNG
jgi:hypothetical protein